MNPDHMEPSTTDFGGMHDLELSSDELRTLVNGLEARTDELAERIDELVNAGNDEAAKEYLLVHWKTAKLAASIGSILDR